MNVGGEDKQRIEELIEVLGHIAGGDFSARFALTDSSDEIEAIGVGINMLAEEIESKVNELERFNKVFVGREVAMVDLKQKNKELNEALEKALRRADSSNETKV